MQPVKFEDSDYNKALIWFICAIILLWIFTFFCGSAVGLYKSILPNWLAWMLAFIFGIIWNFQISSLPVLKIRVTLNYVMFSRSFIGDIYDIKIPCNRIIAVIADKEPAAQLIKRHFGITGLAKFIHKQIVITRPDQSKVLKIRIGTPRGQALVIETSKSIFLLSCPDAHKAASVIRQVCGIDETPVDIETYFSKDAGQGIREAKDAGKAEV
jgi:hypothetical protein